MSPEENKAMLRRLFEDGLNKDNQRVIDELIAPNYVNYNMPAPGPGPEGFKQVIGMFRNAFPDIHITIEELIAEGDKIVSRGVMTGTHRGEFMGIPPTGKCVDVDYLDIWRIENGKFVENWVQLDMMGMMQQLGGAQASATRNATEDAERSHGGFTRSLDENKALVRETMLEMWNKGNLDVADKMYANDYVYHDPSLQQPVTGPKGLKEFVATCRKAFPNMHVTIEDQIAQGDRVVTRWVATGTHRGDFMGIPATGAQFTELGLTISRITGGRIIEEWNSSNALDVMRQMGVVPPSTGKGI